MNIDTFVLRPFAEQSLMLHDTVMGMEARHLSFFRKPMSDDEMAPKGLCNAVIIARKGAEYLKIWLESYEGFNEDKWSEHSVVSASCPRRKKRVLLFVMGPRGGTLWAVGKEGARRARGEDERFGIKRWASKRKGGDERVSLVERTGEQSRKITVGDVELGRRSPGAQTVPV